MDNLSMTSYQLELDIRNLLRDNINYVPSSPAEFAGNTFSDQHILDAMNFAIKEFCIRMSATYTEIQVTLTSNSISLPGDSLEPVRVFSSLSGNLTPTNKEWESIKNPFWKVQTGPAPISWYINDSKTLTIYPIPTTPGDMVLGYIQMPMLLTSSQPYSVSQANVGQWYSIVTHGNTDFTHLGSTDNNVGTQFKITSVGSGTGMISEIVDPRVLPQYQSYLQYAAAFNLLNYAGDQQSIALASEYLRMFEDFINGNVPSNNPNLKPETNPQMKLPRKVRRGLAL